MKAGLSSFASHDIRHTELAELGPCLTSPHFSPYSGRAHNLRLYLPLMALRELALDVSCSSKSTQHKTKSLIKSNTSSSVQKPDIHPT